MEAQRPRVLALGLSDAEARSIEPLCGVLRRAQTLGAYLSQFNWSETDIVVAGPALNGETMQAAHLLTLGRVRYRRRNAKGEVAARSMSWVWNTERETAVAAHCQQRYVTLSAELAQSLRGSASPPDIFGHRHLGEGDQYTQLVTTTSGYAAGLRLVIEHEPEGETIDLVLPNVPNLSEWFRAFLEDIHSTDPDRVPTKPPRLMKPSDWYTPEEENLAQEIAAATLEVERLGEVQAELETKLNEAGTAADSGIRQALWGNGGELVTAVGGVLTDLGFSVRDMDAGLPIGAPKREDLRLTHDGYPDWEAIVEVKGYSGGTRTSDARQIREQRERYTGENSRVPDLTLWLANPHRETDPSSRPRPDGQVGDTARLIGAVHALSSDLYLQWTHVKAGRLSQDVVVGSLVRAEPGLWVPPSVAASSDGVH